MTKRIAMWSGPRNISTAMMRAWENRSDTVVCDEPLYAHYLRETGLDHPGRDQVLAAQENDWRLVVEQLTGPIPGGREIYYQKHMAHHLLPDMERDWIARLGNALLIRDPAEMLSSLSKVTPDPRIEDTGFPQQWELCEHLKELSGSMPPIIDARDVLKNPRALLMKLCDAMDVPFMETMLSWPAGPRDGDGVWAQHWYAAVEKSTGFEPYRPREVQLSRHLHSVLDKCRDIYDRLYAHRIVA